MAPKVCAQGLFQDVRTAFAQMIRLRPPYRKTKAEAEVVASSNEAPWSGLGLRV